MHSDANDVVIVGYGPVGMMAAALLGRMGHRVTVLERHLDLYGQPRAATFDHDAARVFQMLGCTDDVLESAVPQAVYEWVNAKGEILLEMRPRDPGPLGWAEMYLMYQPHLEETLDRVVMRIPNVEVRKGMTAIDLRAGDGGATVVAQDVRSGRTERLSGRFLLGCDGGNSFVRSHLGIDCDDYGFCRDWLVFDFKEKRELRLPLSRQLCDPDQPGVMIQLGKGFRRWSFMLLPGESADEALRPERVWQRISRWATPDDVEIVRLATYTFQSLIAARWRVGPVLLLGDAAHQMPPFLGQGMCSGFRDAANVAWKLDLVLRGAAGESVLDTYQGEREPHVRWITEKAIELGRIQTLSDKAAAAERDREMLLQRSEATGPPDNVEYPGLVDGLLARSEDGALRPLSGQQFIQGVVRASGRTGLFDDVVGRGFLVVVRSGDPAALLSDTLLASWQAIGGVVATLDGTGSLASASIVDVDGVYEAWFAANDCAAVVVRPDYYIFDTVEELEQLEPVVAEALQQLGSSGKRSVAQHRAASSAPA